MLSNQTGIIDRFTLFHDSGARAAVEKDIGYTFHNPDLLAQAFTRSSYVKEVFAATGIATLDGNETLEFIGDKVLDITVLKALVTRYRDPAEETAILGKIRPQNLVQEHCIPACYRPFRNEGEMTKIKSALVCSQSLSSEIRRLGWSSYLIMGKSDEMNGVSEEQSVQEDLFEAVLGAVALDSDWNMEVLEGVVERMLRLSERLDEGVDVRNVIGELQERSEKEFGRLPAYEYREGTDWFSCTVSLGEPSPAMAGLQTTQFTGVGRSKREAAVQAAGEALDYLHRQVRSCGRVEAMVGAPDPLRAVNQLQELWQKHYTCRGIELSKPIYTIQAQEKNSETGNDCWVCTCRVLPNVEEQCGANTKSEAKQCSAYFVIRRLIELESRNEDQND